MGAEIPRKTNRIGVPLEIVLECSSGKREARISDLSLGGCYIDSIAGVTEGEVVHFKLAVPNSKSQDMSGTVVYVHDGVGFGLRFDSLSYEQRQVLRKFVLSNGGTL